MTSSARPKTFAYFDTSVIVKNYVREAGSDRARQLLRTHRVVTSAIAALESLSAFRRNLVSNVIDDAGYSAILFNARVNFQGIAASGGGKPPPQLYRGGFAGHLCIFASDSSNHSL